MTTRDKTYKPSSRGICIYKIRETNSPLHKEHRGFRMVVAVPNMQGHKAFSSTPAASFAKSFMLFQSSDYSIDEVQKKVEEHIRWLKNKKGFIEVVPAEEYELRMELLMAKNNGAQHKQLEEV